MYKPMVGKIVKEGDTLDNTSLSISFSDSLKEDAVSCISEFAERGLDAIMDDGILKDVPIISTAISLYKIGNSVKERHNIKKLIVFLNEFNNGIANPEKRQTIKRQSMLYKTGVEYGDYTLNHVQGCAHGCKYPCYAMQMAKRFGKVTSYEEWCEPKLAENALEILDKEIPKLKDKIQSVHLCFTTDPFMYGYDEVSKMSIKIIQKLNANDIKCSVLTKGILPIELSQLSAENEYGITLVSLNEEFRNRFEPNSADFQARIQALRALHDAGCYTWVSIEPYPTPNLINQDLEEILDAIDFVDKIIFGRMHYNKEITAYKEHKSFFNQCANQVICFCATKNIAYHIKKGTISE